MDVIHRQSIIKIRDYDMIKKDTTYHVYSIVTSLKILIILV